MNCKQTLFRNIYNSQKFIINMFLGSVTLIILYVFFAKIHPVAPWDGDDWATIGTFITTSDFGIPLIGNYERVLPVMLGTIMGYIAAFVFYPLTGDYINSIVIANSIVLTVSIFISLIMLYRFFCRTLNAKYQNALLGVAIFLAIGFLLFKVIYKSPYLYWQYNMCTVYYYSVPSYLASAYMLWMIMDRTFNKNEIITRKKSFAIIISYLIIFSFSPAATMIAVTVFWYLLDDLIKKKNIIKVVKSNVVYILILIFYVIEIYAEFGRTFGTGYLTSDGNLLDGLQSSMYVILSAFKTIHPMVQMVSLFALVIAMIIWHQKKVKKKLTNIDYNYKRVWVTLWRIFLSVFLYFLFLGSISLSHIVRDNGFVRMDSMYIFYFIAIVMIVVCLIYILENAKNIGTFIPLIVVVLLYPIISPLYSYSDSIYTDSSAKQKYNIMSKIVEEAKKQDIDGNVNMKVHIPYTTYDGPIETILYIHHIIEKPGRIEVIYDVQNQFYIEKIE